MNNFSHVMIIEGESNSSLSRAKEICVEILGKKFENKILNNVCSDIIFIELNEKKSIGVSKIRQITENLLLKPVECELKIYIFKDSQNLTDQAQNALLKVFEDPPKHVIFILLCENYKKLLPTIISRSNLIFVNNRLVNIEQNENYDHVKFIEYLINDKTINIMMLLSKYQNKSDLIKFLNESKEKVIENIISEKISLDSIFVCNKIDYYIDLISKNISRSLVSLKSVDKKQIFK